MTVSDASAALREHDRFLLLTHKNPDGDTVMSAAALCLALRRLGKTAYLFPNPQFTKKQLAYMNDLTAGEEYAPEYTVSVDISTDTLFPKGYHGGVDLRIDHHASATSFAPLELVEPGRSACGEIVFDLIRELTGTVTETEATLLYIALTTDTGAFQYANVNSSSFEAAAELLHCGAEHQRVMQDFFRKTSAARLRLEGMIYSGLRYYFDGGLVVATVTRAMLQEAGATEDDLDDLAGLSGRAETARMNITIRELPDGGSKVSVRSAPGVSSMALCEAFGGGGHLLASGCTIAEPPRKAEQLLLEAVEAMDLLSGEKKLISEAVAVAAEKKPAENATPPLKTAEVSQKTGTGASRSGQKKSPSAAKRGGGGKSNKNKGRKK